VKTVIKVAPRDVMYQMGRERIDGLQYGICSWCNEPTTLGTLLTRSRWHRGVPESASAFLCDPCYLAISADDHAYIAWHLTPA
jgi:hypothetical protein